MSYLPEKTRAEEESRRSALQNPASPNMVIVLVVIAALYFGRDIFLPLAIAVLLSFMLAPLVSFLRRRRVPRAPAVISVVALAFLGIFAFGTIVAGQVSQLGANLPTYQSNIETKIRSLRDTATSGGIMQHASKMLRDLGREIQSEEPGEAADPAEAGAAVEETPPLPVEVRQPAPQPLEILQNVIGPLVGPVATGGIVIVFVIFMLLQREDLRDRFIRLAGASDINRTTQAISDAGRRVGRYLLMQLIVNITYGVPIGIGLWVIGVPNPLLWGMLTVVLRFVPYVGPVIGALFPLALAVAVDPGWSMLLWTMILFVCMELFSNNVAEPYLYGSSTGLSPVAIILAAIFWTWLWGPVGLLVSTPLTVCFVVLGRHVPQFSFLDVLLGTEPVLSPAESLYQRLLAGDPAEATERAEDYLEEHSLHRFYDDVAVPALVMGEKDRARGVLDDERRAEVAAGMLTLIDNLDEQEIGEEGMIGPFPPAPPGRVLVAGGRGNLDDAAATLLLDLLHREGMEAQFASFALIEARNLASLEVGRVDLVTLCYLNAGSAAHARYTVRRFHRRFPDAVVQVCFLGLEADSGATQLADRIRADLFASTLEEARMQIRSRHSPDPVRAAEKMEAAATGEEAGSLLTMVGLGGASGSG